jgi:hypothetical protein
MVAVPINRTPLPFLLPFAIELNEVLPGLVCFLFRLPRALLDELQDLRPAIHELLPNSGSIFLFFIKKDRLHLLGRPSRCRLILVGYRVVRRCQ